MKRLLAAFALLWLLSCADSSLAGEPYLKLSSEDGGMSLRVSWEDVEGASEFSLKADGVELYRGSDTTFLLTSPAKKIEVFAHAGTDLSSRDTSLALTVDTFELGDRDVPVYSPAASVSLSSGNVTLYEIDTTTDYSTFDFYIEDSTYGAYNGNRKLLVSSSFSFWIPDSESTATLSTTRFAAFKEMPVGDTFPPSGWYYSDYFPQDSTALDTSVWYAVMLVRGAADNSADTTSVYYMKLRPYAIATSVFFESRFQLVKGLRWAF